MDSTWKRLIGWGRAQQTEEALAALRQQREALEKALREVTQQTKRPEGAVKNDS